MKILDVKELKIPEIKVIKFQRFTDHRGYFTEIMRYPDIFPVMPNGFNDFVQMNETWSKAGTFRGLHFQWNPYMGKLVRCITGYLIDFALDIRLNSPTFGKIISYNMPDNKKEDYSEWIWVPPGFAHGTLLLENSIIEYFCDGQYNENCEAGITVFDEDIDWSSSDHHSTAEYHPELSIAHITDKDKNAFTLRQWQKNPNAKEFIYGEI